MSENRNTSSQLPWKEILGFSSVIIAAYISYLGIRSQTELPLQATQTAEARLTFSARQVGENANIEVPVEATLTFTPINALVPTAIPTITLTNTLVPTAIPTNTPTNTLVPTATPEIIIYSSGGNITYGTGNEWRFSTEISPIKIKIELDQPPNNCKLNVYIWDRDAKQVIFEEFLQASQRSYLAHAKIVSYTNYTIGVGVPIENQYSSCSISDKYTYEITVSEP